MILFAIIFGLNAIVAFVGNLFVLLVVAIYNRFHKKRYILLASLALSDLLFAILVVSNRAAANALEQWPFGTTWCHGNVFIARLLHLTTMFHLCAISHERYTAIVRQPLTYTDNFTKMRIFLYLTLLWFLPAAISQGPFIGWGDFTYNPGIFTCEQHWDRHTTFPLLISSFLIPLILISFLNYKVLKVVCQIQSSFKVVSGLSSIENKTADELTGQQSCFSNNQSQNPNQQHTRKCKSPDDTKGEGHGPLSQIQNATVKSFLPSQMQDEENDLYRPYPAETTLLQAHQVGEVLTAQYRSNDGSPHRFHGGRSHSSPKHLHSLVDVPKNQSFFNGQSNNCNEAVEIGCSNAKISQRHHQQTHRHAVAEREHDKLDEITIEMVFAQKGQSSRQPQNFGTIQDNDGLQIGGIKSQSLRKERKTGRRTVYKITTKNAVGVATDVNRSQRERPSLGEHKIKIPSQKKEVYPECDFEAVSHPVTKAKALPVHLREEDCLTPHINRGTFQDEQAKEREMPMNGSPSNCHTLQAPAKNWVPKQREKPGETVMLLAKLLGEGKAARDVMIIIGTFILCYLPLWIMALYRSLGGRTAAKTTLSIHYIYSFSMLCNPIIYSVRKKGFRKALKKMLRL